jgi:hypothetical protein
MSKPLLLISALLIAPAAQAQYCQGEVSLKRSADALEQKLRLPAPKNADCHGDGADEAVGPLSAEYTREELARFVDENKAVFAASTQFGGCEGETSYDRIAGNAALAIIAYGLGYDAPEKLALGIFLENIKRVDTISIPVDLPTDAESDVNRFDNLHERGSRAHASRRGKQPRRARDY